MPLQFAAHSSQAEAPATPLFARFARWVERQVGRSSTFVLAIAVDLKADRGLLLRRRHSDWGWASASFDFEAAWLSEEPAQARGTEAHNELARAFHKARPPPAVG
jgi:hypothetical protein